MPTSTLMDPVTVAAASTESGNTVVENDQACFGYDCERKQQCLRHAVLRANVPCFPVYDRRCGSQRDEFIQWDGKLVAAVPSLHR